MYMYLQGNKGQKHAKPINEILYSEHVIPANIYTIVIGPDKYFLMYDY